MKTSPLRLDHNPIPAGSDTQAVTLALPNAGIEILGIDPRHFGPAFSAIARFRNIKSPLFCRNRAAQVCSEAPDNTGVGGHGVDGDRLQEAACELVTPGKIPDLMNSAIVQVFVDGGRSLRQ